jgi:hypothetical protein
MLACKPRNAGDMIGVFMGDDNGIEAVRLQSKPRQSRCRIAETESAIEP